MPCFPVARWSLIRDRRKVKYVGGYPLVAGIDYASRKSLPRDSNGFEPLEGYFDRKSDSGMSTE